MDTPAAKQQRQSGAGRETARPLFICACGAKWARAPEADGKAHPDVRGEAWRHARSGEVRYALPGFLPRRCWFCWNEYPELIGRYIPRRELVCAEPSAAEQERMGLNVRAGVQL